LGEGACGGLRLGASGGAGSQQAQTQLAQGAVSGLPNFSALAKSRGRLNLDFVYLSVGLLRY